MDRLKQVMIVFTICLGMAVSAPQAHARVYALIVGIDQYHHINPLQGAVNDARDVAKALQTIEDSEVALLIDAEATRDAILSHWHRLTKQAGRGDILIFHFAGHGGRADAVLSGHEAKDNMFLLVGFEETGSGRTERLVDNEVGHMLAREQEATVILVADSCYAGGMARQADKRAATDLRAPGVNLKKDDDSLTDYLRSLGEVAEKDLQHVVWLYAQDQNKLTQEISIEGERRGALSFAFANVLRGKADRNEDGRLDIREIKRYVNKTVVRLTERRQRPSVNAGKGFKKLSFKTEATPVVLPDFDQVRLRVFATNARPRPALKHVAWVDDQAKADLIYDADKQELINRTADPSGRFKDFRTDEARLRALQGAVDKWRLLHFLTQVPDDKAAALSLSDGAKSYQEGEKVRFAIRSDQLEHLVLFNLTFDGKIQLVAPSKAHGTGLAAGYLTPGRETGFASHVVPPFGVDHLIAVTSAERAANLLSTLSGLNNSRNIAALASSLKAELSQRETGIEWLGLYTRPRGDP